MAGIIDNLPDISFIDNAQITEVINQMITDYQDKYRELTGQTVNLAPADPVRLVLYSCALQLYQIMQYVDSAGRLNLLKYSYGEYLDNLAALRGLKRQSATPATTTVRFEISEVLASVYSIPQGTRVTDGNNTVFATDEYAEIAIGDTTVDVPCTCIVAGVQGNGFGVGTFTTLVEALPFVSSVSNLTVTAGGSDEESDEAFAERIYLSSDSYSTAGPAAAYQYWAKAYNPGIGDVYVSSPAPCEVVVSVLMSDGSIPSAEIISGLEDYLSDSNIRPLTDQVTVSAPTQTTFNVTLTYYINSADAAKATQIQNDVTAAINSYIEWQTTKIGRDINQSELISRVMTAGAKRVVVTAPVYTQMTAGAVAKLGTKTITYGGLESD